MKCPLCEKGELKKGKIQEKMFGVDLGKFPAQICTKCKESFTDEKTTKAIEKKAKEKGIWELGKKTKITKSGNSLAVRIPKKIADFLHLKEGREAFVHPQNNKLVIEPN
ncbi:AbrB/MazE/SpoVT family DNA-binding domain-containing protein [Candidatus Woesearchaeota archaeon]|nr:AbrB/MazE/SpoVT family DNA-binding domain-containing protein [Candidatus Woesearchaeota archaeon]